MEHSLNLSSSSVGKEGVCSITANENTCYPEEDEESGWTSYFQDLSQGMMDQSYCSSLDVDGGSSLVSDAASCAAWKFSHQNNHSNSNNNHLVSCSSLVRKSSNLPRKLCFKKTRAKQISDDDPLEDTASSPVNSPKVGDLMNPTEIISRKIDDQLDGSKGKRYQSGNYSELQTDEENFNKGKNNIDCSDLKKRGLCLVPLSMFVNYFG